MPDMQKPQGWFKWPTTDPKDYPEEEEAYNRELALRLRNIGPNGRLPLKA